MSIIGDKLVKSIREKGEKMEAEMSFFQHLEALRWHLIRAALAIVVFAIVAFIYFDDIFDSVIMAPTKASFWTYGKMCQLGDFLHSILPFVNKKDFCVVDIQFPKLINTDMAGQFNLQINSSLMIGFMFGIPYLLFEIWKFVRPALHDKERKAARGFVFYSSFLFLLGVLFGYYVVTPLSVKFLSSYKVSDAITNMFSIDSFISSETMLTIIAGLVFQLPIIVYILSSLGILTPKFMRSSRRYATIIILVLAAIITPSPDALTMLVVAMPLFVLYEFSISISALVERRRKKREQAEWNS